MAISLDLEIERIEGLATTETIPLNERKDAVTIQKMQGIGIPQMPESPQSLQGRVAVPLEDQIDNIDLEAVFEECANSGGNYLSRLQELVAAILAQYQQISEKDKLKLDQLEKEYKLTTLSVANIQKELGWSNLKFALISFGAVFLQFIPGANDVDKAVAKIFAEQVCPKFGDLWNSDLNAKFTSGDKLSQMLLGKYNLLAGAEQTKANDKQQVGDILRKALSNLESASRNG